MVLLHFHPCDVTKDLGMGGAKLHPFSITHVVACGLGWSLFLYTWKFLLHNIAQDPDPPLPSSSIIGQGVTCMLLMGWLGYGVPGIST